MAVPIAPPIYPGPPPLFPITVQGRPGTQGYSLPLVNGDINMPGGSLDNYPGIITTADGQMIAVPI
jgi:hypothetical protein